MPNPIIQAVNDAFQFVKYNNDTRVSFFDAEWSASLKDLPLYSTSANNSDSERLSLWITK